MKKIVRNADLNKDIDENGPYHDIICIEVNCKNEVPKETPIPLETDPIPLETKFKKHEVNSLNNQGIVSVADEIEIRLDDLYEKEYDKNIGYLEYGEYEKYCKVVDEIFSERKFRSVIRKIKIKIFLNKFLDLVRVNKKKRFCLKKEYSVLIGEVLLRASQFNDKTVEEIELSIADRFVRPSIDIEWLKKAMGIEKTTIKSK